MIEKQYCPTCKNLLDGVTAIGKEIPPQRGKICVCFYCGEIMKFDKELKVVALTQQELSEIPVTVKDIIKVIVQQIAERTKLQ